VASKSNPFESYFAEFVRQAGGVVLAEATGQGVQTADYYFEQANIIAELKTLMVDGAADMGQTLEDALLEWGGDITTIPHERNSNNEIVVVASAIPEVVRKRYISKLTQ
jgi:hypothetical protein